MHKCNNPQCGYEINWNGRYKICPKCGYVMHPVKEKARVFPSKKSSIAEEKKEEEFIKPLKTE